MKYLSVAALVLVGAILTGCSKQNNEEPEQPKQDYKVTLTTTVSFASDDEASAPARAMGEGVEPIMRALSDGGVKTFAVGDQMAVAYMNTSGNQVKAVTEALTAGDITNSGKTATFTVTLTEEPFEFKGNYLYYTYPASITTADGGIDYSVLNTQDGTLASLASNLDCCLAYSNWNGSDDLPALTLTNQFAIGKFNIKNEGGDNVTSTITGMTVSDGTYTYTVSREAAAGPIYVAMRPFEDETITFTATDGTNEYVKEVADKTLEAGKMYPINVTMKNMVVDLSALADDYEAEDGMILTGTLSGDYKITVAAGATITLRDAIINGTNDENYDWAGINCEDGDATIILEGTNEVTAFYEDYPAIYIDPNYTLTIKGSGTLTATGGEYGAAIGGGWEIDCGAIVIEGGYITAISDAVASIGKVDEATCTSVTIKSTVGSVNMTNSGVTYNSEMMSDFIDATAVYMGETNVTSYVSGTVNAFWNYMKGAATGLSAEFSQNNQTLRIF